MNIILTLAFLFAAGCLIGWGIEVVFRHFYVHRKYWINPGFLVGPYLPLYGFGLCALYLLASLEPLIPIENSAWRKTLLFLLMAACMTLIEYIAGVIFIRKMHVKLWDYSGMWGNIQGIICPLFSFFWALLSAAYYFLIHPRVLGALAWLSSNLAFSFFIGLFYGVFAVDCFYSFRIVSRIRTLAQEYDILIRYEELKAHVAETAQRGRERVHFLFALPAHESLAGAVRTYAQKTRSAGENLRGHIGKLTERKQK